MLITLWNGEPAHSGREHLNLGDRSVGDWVARISRVEDENETMLTIRSETQ